MNGRKIRKEVDLYANIKHNFDLEQYKYSSNYILFVNLDYEHE